MRRIVVLALACVLASLVVIPARDTAAAGRVRVLSKTMFRADSMLHIHGEVINETSATVGDIKVSARFYNGTTLVGRSYGYAKFHRTAPNKTNPFYVYIYPAPRNVTSVRLSVETFPRNEYRYLSARVLSHRIQPWWDAIELVGEVQNQRSQELRTVLVVATFYDSRGRVVLVESTHSIEFDLSPGETGQYKLGPFWDLDYSSYTVRTEGFTE